MIRHTTPVDGCFVIEPDRRGDARGFFSRLFDATTFAEAGLVAHFVQVNNSLSSEAGTLRGLHYQVAPHGEVKLLRCIAGRIFDVVLDLRDGSPTVGKWAGAELSADNRRLMYVPRGCAHGFLTLDPDSEVIYFADTPYAGGHERIVRWDDPRFAIAWPGRPAVLSDKDRSAPDYDPTWHASGY
jgi:dTDP-4-dehydrorhamnose 3,5-epimerase